MKVWFLSITGNFINWNFLFRRPEILSYILDGYQVRNLPDKLSKNTEDLDYSKDISKDENSITVSEKFKLKTSKIAAARYGKTKTFFESIKNKYGEKIILMKQG